MVCNKRSVRLFPLFTLLGIIALAFLTAVVVRAVYGDYMVEKGDIVDNNIKVTEFTVNDLQKFIDNFDIPQAQADQKKEDLGIDKKNGRKHLTRINFSIKSEDLFGYLVTHPMMREIGCYHDYDIAKDSIKQTLLENKYKILDWINHDTRPKLRIKKRFFRDIGYKVHKNTKDAKPTDRNIIVLLRESRDDGVHSFLVVNAYPM